MRHWLTRLLKPALSRKPARQEARGFHTQPALPPVTNVLSETADIVTDALREGARERNRQRQQEVETKGLSSPPSSFGATTAADTPPSSSLSIFPDQHVDARVRVLCEASSPQERQRRAARYPELQPPHRYLTEKENLVLQWTYWDGLHDAEIKQKLGHAFVPHIVRNEALRKLAKRLASKREPVRKKPQPVPEPVYNPTHKPDARLTELQLASTSARLRQETASKYPELRPPHDTLSDWENRLLELAYWQGHTYKELDNALGFSAGWASNKCNRALRKLVYHSLRPVEGEEVGIEFAQLPPDPRLTELEKVQGTQKRIAAARRFPELRPPHGFLSDLENSVLERYYWQGQTYQKVAENCGLTRNMVREVRNIALRKLHHAYRRTQAQKANHDVKEPDTAQADVSIQTTSVLGEDPRITTLRRLGHPDKRREVARRYPELRPPHDCLREEENDLLELALWQGKTFAEIASLRGHTRKEVGTGVRGALGRLNAHLCRDVHGDEDQLDRVLLALNECGSVKRAAKKLEVGRDVLKTFIARAGIQTRIVFEVEEAE